MSFDLSKCERNSDGHWLCRTADGMKVRIVCQDLTRENGHVLLGVVSQYDGHDDEIRCYTKDGCCSLNGNPSKDDLVNLPRKVTRWVNIYPQAVNPGYCIQLWETKEAADRNSIHGRVACVQLEWEEPS